MALTEKQREQIREEELLRQEVRREICGSKGHKSGAKRQGFWLGLAAGILASWLYTQATCHGYLGGGAKKCSYNSHSGHAMPHAGSGSEQ